MANIGNLIKSKELYFSYKLGHCEFRSFPFWYQRKKGALRSQHTLSVQSKIKSGKYGFLIEYELLGGYTFYVCLAIYHDP